MAEQASSDFSDISIMPLAAPNISRNTLSPQQSTVARVNDDLRARASSLDSEIAALQARLDKLLADRAVVQEGLDTISYPVLTLPFEIISKIFRSTVDSRDVAVSNRVSLQLGHICRMWRQIALSTPELWNALDIRVSYPSLQFLGVQQYLARLFLSRAASLPLDISMYGDPASFRTMLDILIPYSRTWTRISFEFPGDMGMPLIHHQLPALTTLELEGGDFGSMFSDAPLLRHVSLNGVGPQPSALPWAQLISLTLKNCSGDDFAEILGWTPNLLELVVGAVSTPIPLNVLALPKLQSVIFGGAHSDTIATVVSVLDAQIRELKLTHDDLAPFSPPMLYPAALEQFCVDIMGAPPADEPAAPSIECLTPMVALRVLKIVAHCYHPRPPNFLVHVVLRLLDDPGFLPELQSLTLIILPGDPSDFDTDTLCNMLGVRFTGGLRHFELRTYGPVPVLDVRMMDLRANGMQIVLETEPGLEINPWREEF
ncbi:hypothetical protein C8R46DRAFT_1283198 [Mycena filopes]|nr:hypothetical protein C8R46DRAFT_1283198 [Mycena filopes]